MANMKASFDFGSLHNFLHTNSAKELRSKKIAHNTRVIRNSVVLDDGKVQTISFTVRLHENVIAIVKRQSVQIFSGGYQSVTTKERLNHILSDNNLPGVFQHKWVWYVGNKETEFSSGMELAL